MIKKKNKKMRDYKLILSQLFSKLQAQKVSFFVIIRVREDNTLNAQDFHEEVIEISWYGFSI